MVILANERHIGTGSVISFLGAMMEKKNLSWITHSHEPDNKMVMNTELPHPTERNLKHRLPMTN
jgi:hypothetical protein